MKIGVFVGSFDPVHKGHKKVMDHLINNGYVNKVIVVPTLSYWHKNISSSLEDRVNMLKFYEDNSIIIDDRYSKYKYTHEILRKIKKDYDGKLHLIMGADNLLKFYMWKNKEEILSNKILVLGRDNIDVVNYIRLLKDKESFIYVRDFVEEKISSTFIRERIKDNDYGSLKSYLNYDIINYIKENNLYR